MASRVVRSQTLYPFSSITFYLIALLFAIMACIYQMSWLYIICFLFILLGVICSVIHYYKIKKQLIYLVETTSCIIDQKPCDIPTIDGESSIAVLYSHLAILNTRMNAIIERLHQEQGHLKDYIEDISHQIKTPLTSMMLREEMLLEMVQDNQEKELLLHIYHQTEKISLLIESLLNLAQIESHSIEYHKEEYDLEDIILHIQEILLPLLEEYDVHFVFNNIHQFIYCDEKWMSEALENILKNCIEQEAHSTIDISCQNHSTYIDIYIQDHGEGFQKEDMPYIFDRFYQGQKRKGKGIGIGLSMSQGIIQAHHGSIQISNHDGALFHITLPHKNTKSKYPVTNE